MGSTNLGLMLAVAIAVVRKAIAQPTKPATVRKAIVTRTRRNGSSESVDKAAARAKVKAKGKEKQNKEETGIGRATMVNYLAPTITRAMATASSATIVASLTTGQKGGSASKPLWPSKALQRNKRKQ
jgi:hypothetical protein